MRFSLWLAVVTLACNPDSGLTIHDGNTDPEVVFVAPANGEEFDIGATVTFTAHVEDDHTALDALELTWRTTNGGALAGTATLGDGVATLLVTDLAVGEHTVSLTAIDDQGASGEAEVGLVVEVPVVPDADGDGFITEALGGDDCNDADATRHPGATEVCNGADDDCNGLDDDDATDATLWYYDDDLDTFGDPDVDQSACGDPGGRWVALAGDCDDGNNAKFPNNPEICDGLDNDCFNGVDDGLSFATYYTDGDGDTWGLIGSGASHCAQPPGTATRGGDCNDGNDLVNPDRTETCNGVDDDCANGVDDGWPVSTWYYDDDNDTYGDPDVTLDACADPGAKWIARGGDCDDGSNAKFPTNPEICDGLDNDCLNGADNGLTFATYYTDGDGDTWGAIGSGVSACAQPVNSATRGGDCNDGNSLVNPGRTESCNGVDDDCANGVDDGLSFATYYTDGDTDTWGAIGSGVSLCAQPLGSATRGGDCNDGNGLVYPGRAEICNGVDDNCANGIDDGLPTTVWFYDFDDDGFGDPDVTQTKCAAPSAAWTDVGGDCDDGEEFVNPDEQEVCNGRDDDCANGADDADPNVDLLTADTWYYDLDGDTWGRASPTTLACAQPVDYADRSGDCDDTEEFVNPGENEVCGNGVDDDCANGIDDGCVDDYSGTWLLYTPGTNNRKTVTYGCDGWSFAFDTVTIDDAYPAISVRAVGSGTVRVNGCEPGWEVFCLYPPPNDWMTGSFYGAADWSASAVLEPLFGMGYAEYYEWRAQGGGSGTHATFTDSDTFLGSFAWRFEARGAGGGVPAGCNASSTPVEGRRQ